MYIMVLFLVLFSRFVFKYQLNINQRLFIITLVYHLKLEHLLVLYFYMASSISNIIA
jgi:hypothetical protein